MVKPRFVALIPLVALVMGACAPVEGSGAAGSGPRHAYWRADDRILVTDFRDMTAVATDNRFAYGASEHGVVVYDHRFGRFAPPLTVEDGYPRADLPLDLEVDELTGTLWLATRTGALWAYEVPLANEWRWVGTLPGGTGVRLVAHDGTLWARTGSGWFEASMGGAPSRGSPPPEVAASARPELDELEEGSAGFRSMGSTLTVDEWLRRYQITAAAPTNDPSDWFLATWGAGMWAYDDRMLDAQPLRYGSLGRGVSALAAVPGGGGYWFGSDGLDARAGVAQSDAQLQRWAWYEAGREGAPRGPVHALLDSGAGVYAGAHDGLYRFDGTEWTRLTDMDGLPAPTVRSLAYANGTLWAGTDRGLARVIFSGEYADVQRVDGTTGARVLALAQRDSILWMGGDRGLWRLNLRTGALSQPPLEDARLRSRVIGIAFVGETLYALAENALLAWDGASWSAPPIAASLVGIGRPTHLAAHGGVLWIAGSAGAIGIDPVTGAESRFDVPRDIPEGPVRQVLPVDGGVWFATPAGALLVRFE